MFGIQMKIRLDGFFVDLRPLFKADLPNLVTHFNSMKIHMYTSGLYAQTLENEEEWYNKTRSEKDSCVWGIQPQGSEKVVGITSLHGIDMFGSATSGIIIWDTKWWGKGVAKRAHLGRTLFAADYLDRLTIKSSVRSENNGSRRALLGVGYNVTGLEPRTSFRAGKFIDTLNLVWINPERVNILFPEGLPEIYKDGVEKAKIAISTARRVVEFP